MTRDEAIESIKPDACPTCGGKAFRVTNGDGVVLLSIPSQHPIQLVCVECKWASAITHYIHSEPKPEIVYSKSAPPPLAKRPGSDGAKRGKRW